MTQIADRVREVSTSSSTGPMTLQGTVVGFRRFRDAITDGATVPYVIENGAEWEVGYGSFTAPATLNRVTVKASSNSNALVDFAAGQKSIWVDAIADLLTSSTISVSSVNGYTGVVTLAKSDIGLGNVDNTSDANKPVSTATQTALNLKVNTSTLGAASGVATLGSDSKLSASQIPDIAVVDYLGSVANQTAMLALTGQKGDWCIRTDLSTTWVITGSTPSSLSSWTQLSYPTAPVTSVNSKTGAVTLSASDVGAQASITVNGIVKGNGAGTLSAAVSGTDYAPATSGSDILYGNGAGGFSGVTIGSGLSFAGGTLSNASTMTYPGAGIPNSTGSAWGTSYSTTGSGTVVALATSPSFTTPVLGTPTSGTLTNCTGLPVSTGVSGLGTSVATALAVNVGTAGAVVVNGGALGTPSSGTLTNCTGLPISTGVSGLGTNVATFLATPSSANLASAVTDETGSGALVFGTNPTITNYTETSYSANSSTAITLSLANGTMQYITLTGSPTITMPAASAGKSFTLILYTGSGSYTVSWSTVAWASGTTPTVTTTASKKDIFNFYSDGTNWYGSIFGQNF